MRRLLAVAAMAVTIVSLGAGPASADSIVIREVDATGFPTVRISAQVAGPTPDPTNFALRENGRILPKFDVIPLAKTSITVGIVLVVDVSGSMRENDKIGAAKAAAKEFVRRKLPADQIAIVSFSDRSQVVQGFTADASVLSSAIESLTARGETALWDGVDMGRALFDDRPDLQPNLVVLSDGVDTRSVTTSDDARLNAVNSKATVFAVALKGSDFDGSALRLLAEATGGSYDETNDTKSLGDRYETIRRDIQNQYEIVYTSSATGSITISLAASGLRAETTFESGTVSQPPPPAFQPVLVEPSPLARVFGGTLGRLAVALLTLGALGFVGFLAGSSIRSRSRLPEVLRPYDPVTLGRGPDNRGGDLALVETAIIQKAVEATSRALDKRGLLQKLTLRLTQADLPLRPAEAAFFYASAVVVLTLLAVFLKSVLIGAVVLIFAALIPLAALEFLAGRRRRAFAEQLPDMLQALASSLRAGYSILQGAEAVVQQVKDPMAKEMRRALIEARLGRPIDEALGDVARRVGSRDLEWAVMAIAIQREVGGNLAELLQTVSETMVARVRLQREIRALTAEGRMSAIVLGILPGALGVFMYFSNPDYIGVLFERTLGQVMLVGSILLAVVGFVWMKKVIEIEV